MKSGNPELGAGQVNAPFCYNMKKKKNPSEIVIEHTSTKTNNVINFICAGKVDLRDCKLMKSIKSHYDACLSSSCISVGYAFLRMCFLNSASLYLDLNPVRIPYCEPYSHIGWWDLGIVQVS